MFLLFSCPRLFTRALCAVLPGMLSLGAASAPAAPRGKPAPAPLCFVTDVMPQLDRAGCATAACHGSTSGKGGLKLSLFGADPKADFDALTRDGGGRRINRVEPEKSLLLQKISGALPHDKTAAVLPAKSPAYTTLARWIAQHTVYAQANAPQFVALDVTPTEHRLRPGESATLQVFAKFSDGARRDVTRLAHFQSNDHAVAAISPEGRVTAARLGECALVITYLRQSAVVRVVVPQPAPAPFPASDAAGRIDELVYARLKLLGLAPSGVCHDEEFLRRVYLDLTGLLPPVAAARTFLADANPQKRAQLIERLLASDEYADFWALKWGDLLRIKSEYPVRVWPKGVVTYHRWVRDSIAANKPYDQFVRELLTASGSDFRDGPANYFRAHPTKDPLSFAETTSLIFMGVRLECSRCHGHPTERWTLADNLGMAAFFSKVAFKGTGEWKEEIVYVEPKGVVRHPRTKEIVAPKFLGGDTVPVGKEEDARPRFAEWLTAPDNPWFARNAANRVWFWLLGRGLTQEPDDQRPTNPPSHQELLDFLAQELVSHRYDLKHLYRLILNSRTYQRSSVPQPFNRADATHFSHYRVKRLTAEQLLDAIGQVTETTEKYSSKIPEPFTFWPSTTRATQLEDGNAECSFLELFGRPPRDTPYEEERDSEASLRQALYFINSDHLENKVANGQRVKRLLAPPARSDAEIVDEIVLAALARFPTPAEKEKFTAYLAKNKASRPAAVRDLMWAVLNTKEFLFNH
ncbi:MAG: DUF1553 domain-containing protein [Opitutae bacterium]|nr:DUF1553 domain-containing protein [Opitutae bacterium]